MTSAKKHDLPSADRSVSPPAVRRKIEPEHVSDVTVQTHVPAHSETDTSRLTIFSWNVNGVGPFFQPQLQFASNSSTSSGPLRAVLRRHNWPQIFGLQEVKIRNTDKVTQRRLALAANNGADTGEPLYEAIFNLPRDKYNATGWGGRVHGVASLVRSDFVQEITTTRHPDWDLEGRFLIHELGCGLVVFNGYWINGTSAPYRSSQTGLPNGDRHDLKLRYHTRVLEEVLRYEARDYHVVLVGDMNVARDHIDGHPNLRVNPIQHVHNREDFNNKFFNDPNGMRGIDVFRHLHGKQRKYTYHNRNRGWGESADRVDLIIASRGLIETRKAVITCDICDTQEDAGHSDHVPLFITLDMSKLWNEDRLVDKPSYPKNR